MRRFSCERGLAMGTILLIVFVAAILAFTLATASTYQLKVSQSLDEQAHARNLAESVVNQALARLSERPEFGKRGETLRTTLDDLGEAVLSFGPGQEGTRSLHNLEDRNPLSVGSVTIPGESVRLVGLATVGRSQVVLECLYQRPAFPVALSTGNSLKANGLYLGGLLNGQAFPGSVAALTPAMTRPADLVVNGTSTELDATTNILGNVNAAGSASIAPGAKIKGSVRTDVTPAVLPVLSRSDIVRKLDDSGIRPGTPQPDGSPNVLVVDCYDEQTGHLHHNGHLEMAGGVLHVKGNLSINGEVRGRGIILVDGSATIRGRATVSADDSINIITGGDLTLNGGQFRGFLYSDGIFRADQTTIFGSVVSHGQNGHTEVSNVNLIQGDESVSTSFGLTERYTDLNYTVFWKIDPVRNPSTGQVRFNYAVSVYRGNTRINNRSSSRFIASRRRTNRTKDQVLAEVPAFIKLSTPPFGFPLPIPSLLGDRVAVELIVKGNKLSQAVPPADQVISLNLNELLAPVQRDRILLWRYREG